MACNNLTLGLDPSCNALNKTGGLHKRVWVGEQSILDGYTVNDSTLDISSLELVSASPANTLKKFIGAKLKNSSTTPLEVGENLNVFNQTVNLILFHYSSLDKFAIENLANVEDAFVIVQNTKSQLIVYGIDTGSEDSDDPLGGLNASAGDGGSGVLLNDPTSYTITLSGQHRIMERVFNVSSAAYVAATGKAGFSGDPTLAQNIEYLDAISA